MSIQLSGSPTIDSTFTSAGTRSELVAQFQVQLTAAGWSVISGSGTGDVVMESATTPQGLKTRVEAIDPGSGNCAQFKIKDNAALVGPVIIFLLPVGGQTFRLWADKYQFFYFLSGTDMTRQRSLVCGGVPWVPNFIRDTLTNPYAGWLHGNGTSDTSTLQLTNTFRRTLVASTIQNYSALWNGAAFGDSTSTSRFGLLCQSSLTPIDDLWEDGTWTIFEPVFVWQAAGFPGPVRHGVMWDAVLLSKSFDSETRRVFGNITWRGVTHQNAGVGGVGRGSLMLIVPEE